MLRNSKKADNTFRLSQNQENALEQVIALQITAIQIAGINRIPPQIIKEEMQKRGIL